MREFDDISLDEAKADIHDALLTIKRCWPRPNAPRGTGGVGSHKGHKPGSAAPGGSPTVLRASLVRTLACWVHAALDDGKIEIPPKANVDLSNPVTSVKVLLPHVGTLVGWSQARHLWKELRQEARTIERLTREPATGVRIGNCPRERVLVSGERVTCGGDLWATEGRASDVKCPLCGAKDTVEQWRREIVGDLGVATADELARKLIEWGIRQATPGSVRIMAHRRQIPRASTDPKTGRKVYDVRKVIDALTDSDIDALGA